eukprot:7322419-Prymnesium_polylepis.1
MAARAVARARFLYRCCFGVCPWPCFIAVCRGCARPERGGGPRDGTGKYCPAFSPLRALGERGRPEHRTAMRHAHEHDPGVRTPQSGPAPPGAGRARALGAGRLNCENAKRVYGIMHMRGVTGHPPPQAKAVRICTRRFPSRGFRSPALPHP